MLRTLLALALFLVVAGEAQAAPTWLDETPVFADARQADASAAMAPDGTVIVARFTDNGSLEIRERPPGGEFGETITRRPITIAPAPNLKVLTGADGTAAVLFDVGIVRFASVRPPGGSWSAPTGVGTAGAAVLAHDGELWLAGNSGDDPNRLAVFRKDARILLPSPPAGASDLAPALTVARDGGVHVVFGRARQTRGDDECALETSVWAVDISAEGTVGPEQPIDNFLASGGEDCDFNQGSRLQGPLLLAGDTVLYGAIRVSDFVGSTRAQHRQGGGYALDAPIPGDAVPLALVDGTAVLNEGGAATLARRAADGHWGLQPLGPVRSVALAPAAVAYVELGGRVVGRSLDGGAPTELRGEGSQMLAAGADAEGNAVALFSAPRPGGFSLFADGYDAAGPRLTEVSIDPDARAGIGAPFIVSGLDVWSGPLRLATWDFGDGTQEEGVANGHTFEAPGRYTVTVTGRDDVGNTTSAAGAVTAVAVPIPLVPTFPPRRHGRVPHLTRLSVSRAGKLTLRLDVAARVKVVLTRGKARRALTRSLRAGTRKITLPRLPKGTWKLVVTATDRAGNTSASKRLTVRVR